MLTEDDYNFASICSVSQMAAQLKLSRARLYQLIDNGVFPPPVYCRLSRKPLYPSCLQNTCLEIRRTGIGLNGRFARFNQKRKSVKPNLLHKQLATILRRLGFEVTVGHVKKSLQRLGLVVKSEMDINGETIQELVKHFYGKRKGSV